MYNVYYEWVSYTKDGKEKKFVSYFILVGDTKINIRGADKQDTNYNQTLLDGARKLGLIKKYENN